MDSADRLKDECEQLLGKAVGVYLAIQDAQKQLDRQLDSSYADGSLEVGDKMARLSAAALDYDRRIADKLAAMPEIPDRINDLLAKRRDLLQELVEHNAGLSVKAGNVKALLQHQMTSIRDNNRAIGGYKSGTSKGGRIMTTSA